MTEQTTSPRDLRSAERAAVRDWKSGDVLAAFDDLYAKVRKQANDAESWYFFKRKKKRAYGYWLRIIALIIGTGAGVLPVIAEMTENSVSPAWSTLALAVAALLVAIDRLAGNTSGWVRYVLAGQALVRLQRELDVEWEQERFRLARDTGDESVEKAFEFIRAASARVSDIVEIETKKWAEEFGTALDELSAGHSKLRPGSRPPSRGGQP